MMNNLSIWKVRQDKPKNAGKCTRNQWTVLVSMRILCFRSKRIRSGSGSKVWWSKIVKNPIFGWKIVIFLSLGIHEGRSRLALQNSKVGNPALQNMKVSLFLLLPVIPNADSDPADLNSMRIHADTNPDQHCFKPRVSVHVPIYLLVPHR